MKKFTYVKLALAALFLFIEISASFGNIQYGILPTNADQQDAIDAWQQFKQGLISDNTPDPSSMLRHYRKSETRGEYQAWSLIMAVMFDDLETAEKLWNFCKYYIPRQNYGMVPWLIRSNYDSFGGHSVGDADFDYCIALDMAARKWPDWVGDDGHNWDHWARYYINQVYDVKRAILENPDSPNAISGKYMDPDGLQEGVDEHYYLHYSPYGYLNNWRDRTGQKNWTEEVDGLESVYDAEINLQKITLAKYYGTSQDNLYCWPPHQVRKTGYAADDLTKKYDSGWNMMNWGPSRITLRACHAYINNGDAHGAKMMRFLADRWWEETGGDPANIRKGYSLNTCGGWGDPTAWMIGGAAVVSMVDEQYRPMLDNMYDALVNLNVSGDPHSQIAKAYYLMHLTGLMDFAIADPSDNLTFRVTDESDNAIEGATIAIEDKVLTTNAFGEASIDLPNGDYEYTVTADKYKDTTGTVSVSGSEVTEEITLTKKTYYPVTLQVTDESDNAIEGATVAIDDTELTTNASGEANIELPNGDYDYTVTADRHQDTTGTVSVSGSEVTEEVTLQEIPYYSVTFQVTDESDNAIEGAAVAIDDTELTTNASGEASIELPNGDYEYTVTADGYQATGTFSVSGSEVIEEVILQQIADITLQAEDADELAGANIESTLSDFNGTGYVYLRSAEDYGRIVWNNIELNPGIYSVQVRSQADYSDNASLFVNDTEYALPLPGASDWTYTTVSNVTFEATNTLKINNGKQQNIDELIIVNGQTPNFSNSSELQSIRVYPNPVSGGTLYLTDYADIKLYSMQGKILLEKNHVNSIDVSDLKQGIYLLSTGATFRKIVIE